MTADLAINDNIANANAGGDEQVIAAAVLVATAFRLRDEEALVTMLRRLTAAVAKLEQKTDQRELMSG